MGRACRSPLQPGESCTATTLGGPCLTTTELTISCPADNEDPTRHPDVAGAVPDYVTCFVCSLALDSQKDNDPRKGFVAITISFGASIVDGNVSEAGISHYSVFLADEAGSRLPGLGPVANVSVDESAAPPTWRCCKADFYGGTLVSAELPPNVTTVRLEVVPVSSEVGAPPLPSGLMTDMVLDWEDRAFLRTAGALPGAVPPWPLRVLPLQLLFLFAPLVLRATVADRTAP